MSHAGELDLFDRFKDIIHGGPPSVAEPAPVIISEAEPPPDVVRVILDAFACSGCGRFAFQVPTTCFWCKRG